MCHPVSVKGMTTPHIINAQCLYYIKPDKQTKNADSTNKVVELDSLLLQLPKPYSSNLTTYSSHRAESVCGGGGVVEGKIKQALGIW